MFRKPGIVTAPPTIGAGGTKTALGAALSSLGKATFNPNSQIAPAYSAQLSAQRVAAAPQMKQAAIGNKITKGTQR